MKKLISFFLCTLMIMSLSLTVFAAPASDATDEKFAPAGTSEPGAEVQATEHKHHWEWKYSANGGYQISSSGCAAITWHHYECACGAIDDSRIIEPEKPHSGSPYASSCNGATQTWQCACSRCGTNYTETHACPGAGHGSTCRWLPV